MPFSTDRDLLVLEPMLFNDVAFAAHKRLEVTDGVVSGTSLTSATADFEAAQIDAGDVVLIADVACEVISRQGPGELIVSRLRGALAAAQIPPGDGAALTVIHRTFEPQAQIIHDELLRILGIDPDGAGPPGSPTEDAIVSLSVMRNLEALKTMAHIYESAIALGAEENNAVFTARAERYRNRYRLASRQSLVRLDLDGDGAADASKDMSLMELLRV